MAAVSHLVQPQFQVTDLEARQVQHLHQALLTPNLLLPARKEQVYRLAVQVHPVLR